METSVRRRPASAHMAQAALFTHACTAALAVKESRLRGAAPLQRADKECE